MKQSLFLKEMQLFLTKYCQQERHLSRQTILSYRDTMKLLIRYFRDHKKKAPTSLLLSDLTYESVADFLLNLEKTRKVSISTRNQRLCAIKSFCRYIIFKHPDYAETISRTMNVPQKKKSKTPRVFLNTSEIKALLNAVDRSTWIGRRDYMLLDFCIRTGVRVSELISLTLENVVLNKSPYITVFGKGRKERTVPIDRQFGVTLNKWIISIKERGHTHLFPSNRGSQMSSDAVQFLLRKYIKIAVKTHPSLESKEISPHSLRHTTAMQLLDRGVDVQIIALWLGHEQIETTQVYFSESLSIKRKALKKTRLSFDIELPVSRKSDISFLDDI